MLRERPIGLPEDGVSGMKVVKFGKNIGTKTMISVESLGIYEVKHFSTEEGVISFETDDGKKIMTNRLFHLIEERTHAL